MPFWGISSAGRAPALQAGGRRFDPVILHQRKSEVKEFSTEHVSVHHGQIERSGVMSATSVLCTAFRSKRIPISTCSLTIWKKHNEKLSVREYWFE